VLPLMGRQASGMVFVSSRIWHSRLHAAYFGFGKALYLTGSEESKGLNTRS